MQEEWKQVPDLLHKLTPEQNDEWVGKYLVSNLGRIKSIKNKNKILKPSKLQTGYLVLSTKIGGREGKCLAERIHRLVAIAFIPNTENKPEVNHKNGDKENNTVYNLEWSTPSENSLHSVHVLDNKPQKGFKNPLAKLTEEQASYVRLKYKPKHKLFGARALARELGVHHSTILKYKG
jgi:hypothetical protein